MRPVPQYSLRDDPVTGAARRDFCLAPSLREEEEEEDRATLAKGRARRRIAKRAEDDGERMAAMWVAAIRDRARTRKVRKEEAKLQIIL